MKQAFKQSPQRLTAYALIAVFVISAVLVGIGVGARGGMDPADTRKGIVWVVALQYGTDGNPVSMGTGTGWAIGQPNKPVEYFVTNAHVVQNAYIAPREQGGAGNIDLYFSAAESDKVSAKVVYYSAPEEKDIAILQLPSPTVKRSALVLRPSDSVKIGETAYALGYPAISSEVQGYTTFDQSDITVTRGVVSKRTNVAWAAYDVFQMDVAIAAGNSGGPLVDERGFVLGVNTAGLQTSVSDQIAVDVGMNYAVVTNELTRILDNEKLPYTLMSAKDWMIYVFSPLAAISLLAALWFLFGKQNRAFAAAGGGNVGGGKASAKAPAGQAKRDPVLRGVGGVYAGQKFAMERKLTIGRDTAKCNIVYKADTPGISGSHCSIAYDAATDSFLLTDNGSSYGTFLGNGRKLAPHVPEKLMSGDSFYLANTDNRFIVTKE